MGEQGAYGGGERRDQGVDRRQDRAAATVAQGVELAALVERVTLLRRIVSWMIAVGIIGMVLAIAWVYVQSYTGRVEVVKTQRLGCARGLFDRAESIRSEMDDAEFRHEAAISRAGGTQELAAALKRAKAGRTLPTLDLRQSIRYEMLADSALDRVAARKQRLLGGNLVLLEQRVPRGRPGYGSPTAAAKAEAKVACTRAYPNASPLPWVSAHPQSS